MAVDVGGEGGRVADEWGRNWLIVNRGNSLAKCFGGKGPKAEMGYHLYYLLGTSIICIEMDILLLLLL